MQKSAYIYSEGIYLLKVNNENYSKKKTHRNDLIDMKTLRNIDIALLSLLLTLKRFNTFS